MSDMPHEPSPDSPPVSDDLPVVPVPVGAPVGAKHCTNCGAARGSGRFCQECGHAFEDTEAAAPAAAPAGATALSESSPEQPWWRRTPVLIGGIALVLVLAAVAITKIAGGSGHTLTGDLTLTSGTGVSSTGSGSCEGRGGYDDIHAGTQVVVKDGAGATIAFGSLGQGVKGTGAVCTFSFTVPKVPDADIYVVSAGNDQRGGVRYTKSDLERADWTVFLSLGG